MFDFFTPFPDRLDNAIHADLDVHLCPYFSDMDVCGLEPSHCEVCLKEEIKMLRKYLKEVRLKNGKK